MENEINSLRKTARVAGFLYLFLILQGVYGIMYVSSQIIVPQNDTATINNILAHEFLFRTGIVINQFIGPITFVCLALVLYRLLRKVNDFQAKLMVALVLVQIPVAFLLETFNLTSLMILKGEAIKTFNHDQKQDFATLFLAIHRYGLITSELFWGIWLIPFGQLVYKSVFIPRIIGALLIVGGIAYVVDSFTFVLFPNAHSTVSQYVIVASVGEIGVTLWLLIKGVRVKQQSA